MDVGLYWVPRNQDKQRQYKVYCISYEIQHRASLDDFQGLRLYEIIIIFNKNCIELKIYIQK